MLQMRTRPLMKFRPSQLMQLLWLWRLHRAVDQLESPRLGQRMQLLARPMQQLMSRPGIMSATELYQLEPSRPLRPNMKRRLQHGRRQQCTYHGRYR